MSEREDLDMSVDEGEAPAPAVPVAPATALPRGPTQTMYRPDGAAVEVPHDEVAHAIRTGAAGFAKDQPVLIEDADGKPRTVSGKTAADLFTSARGLGTRVIDRATAEEHIVKDVYESPLGYAHAGGAGLARGLTFGLSDAALAASSPEQREALANSKRINPGTNLAGEGVGLLASALPTGGEGLVAKGLEGATALPRAVSALGHGAEGLALRGAEGLGLAREGLTAKTLASTAQAGTEGAFYGVGNALSDSAIQNEDLTAEKILAGAGHGALLGAGAGAGLSLLGAGAAAIGRKAVDGASSAAGGLLERLGGGAEKVAAKEGELGEHLAERSGIKNFLSGVEKDHSLKATGASQGQIAELRAKGSEVEQRVVDQLHDQLPELAGKESLAKVSREELAAAAEKNQQKWGQEIGDSLKGLDAAGAKPDVSKIIEEAREKILKPLQETPFAEATTAHAEKAIESLDRHLSEATTFEGLHTMRVRLQKEIKGNPTSELNGARREFRNLVEEHLLDSAEKASTELGSDFAARYRAAKQQYQAAAWLTDATEKGAVKELGNRTLGFSEQVGGAAGAQALGAAGGALLGPVGHVLGAGVGAVGGAVVQNYVRRYGDQLAAHFARTAVRTDLVKAASVGIDHAIDGTIGKFLGTKTKLADLAPKVPGVGAIAPRIDRPQHADSEKAFEAHRDAVAKYLANPHAKNAEATAGLPPAIADKVSQLGIAKAQYLASKLPQAPAPNPLQPALKPGKVSPAEQARWLRIQRAVDNPLSVLDDLKDGKLSKEGADALKATSPLLFAEIQQQVLGRIQALEKPLTHDKALAVNALLGIPSAPSLTPARIAALQSSFAPTPPPQEGGFGPKNNPNPSSSQSKQIVQQVGTRSESLTQ